MNQPANPVFSILIAHSLDELDSGEWDALSAGAPFQSYRWYRYGERVMADCLPTYIILSLDQRPVARATFWRVRNEQIPLPPGPLRNFVQSLLARWPLLICRSPLSNSSGLILPEPSLRQAAISTLTRLAREQLRQQQGSFLMFDYLTEAETCLPGWPVDFVSITISEPGNILRNRWQSFDEFLLDGNKKDRQHYKRILRKMQAMECNISQKATIIDVEDALDLIRQVEERHGAAPNPWARAMLENLSMVGGTFLEARIANQLVGCGLLFDDNETQLTAALGLASGIPFVYFQLLYTSLQLAIEHHAKTLRWGSGAYDIKKQLGFEPEMNNLVLVSACHPVLSLFLRLAKKYGY